ncbi:MAG: CoA-acylating methylmalonate-semialdehyde dehydrogenase [Deltaproteobacteria bacterium]|nr:CoA-acylating methylmalonate-semialdehyde dehydrogenase [Deltaproteobacteria bacterium]
MKLVNIPTAPVRIKNLIAGSWQTSESTIPVESPYTGTTIAEVDVASPAQVDQAARAAAKAAAEWRRVPIKERTQLLLEFRSKVLANIDELSNLAAMECGKTVGEARAGVLKGIEVIEFAASLQNMQTEGVLEVSRGVTCETRREPMGVVAGITPFNFPAMVPMWQFPIAVTAGNAFILKPSEKVPMSAMRLGELFIEAGYPAGVLSIVNGGKETVEAVIDHPEVKAIGFVGSTPIAKAVYARAASHGKRALALGGAKNHLIVVPDADPDITVDGVVASFTGCAGQRCMAASLMVAVGDVDHLIDAIAKRAREVRLGTDMGAIITKESHQSLLDSLDRAEKDGAKLILDGRSVRPPAGHEGGYWLAPSIIDRAQPDWDCAHRELFGPILTIVRVDTLDQALDLENAHHYGNATSVFTTTGSVARHVTERATTGMVGINIGVPVPREPFSFGGTKDSRFGSGDMTGQGGVELWTFLKKVTTKWALHSDSNWMS